jgi:hypothetical protein
MNDFGSLLIQLLLLGLGWICMLVGGVLLLYALYWLATALRVPAIIAGVRRKGRVLYPVYRYQMPDGSLHEAVSDTGSSRAAGKETGRPVLLRVDPKYPTEARRSIAGFFISGGIFALPGVWMVVVALTRFPTSTVVWVAVAMLLAITTLKIRRALVPVKGRTGFDQFRDAMRAARLKRLGNGEMHTVEEYAADPDKQKEEAAIRAATQSMSPALLMMGVLSILYSVYLGHHEYALFFHGASAEGAIVDIVTEDNLRYPVVSFDPPSGDALQFQSPAPVDDSVQTGDAVQVRYMPKDPKTAALSDAMDMPLFPAFLLFGGTICALAGVTAWRQQRKLNNSKT